MPRRRDRPDEADRKATNVYDRGGIKWARFQVGGREFRGSLSTGNEAVARKRARKWREREIGIAKFGEDRKTYTEAFTLWTDHIATQVSATTAERYAVSLGQLEQWLKPLYVDEIDKETVSTIVRERRSQGVKTATIRRDLTALSSVIEFSIDEGWRDENNPAERRQKKLKERRDPIQLPLAQDIAFVIDRAPGNLARMIEAARDSGCRQDELARAERRLLDRDRRQLTIRRKGNQIRTITLSEAAYAGLSAIPAHLKGKWLFWHGDGEPYRNVSARFNELVKAAQKAAQAAGIEFRPFTFHHLRHFYAVWFLKNGGNIYALQQHLNHKSITTTEIYLDFLTPEEAAAAKAGPSQSTAQPERFEIPK